ncbi:MAG: phosphate ABC transporter permease subunit PstC [Pirellulales bacterium]|nr:phosphate ABC transporter permease subunit PstC [Pirellulales bacterium]
MFAIGGSTWKDKAAAVLLRAVASTSILIVLLIFLFLGKEAAPLAAGPGIKSLLAERWVPVSFQQVRFGLLPLVTGSLLVTLLATLFTIPFGICAAVYVAELAKPWERELLKPFIEILAGIPSVVIGFFGLVVLAPLVKDLFGLSSGLTALTGALLLALMAIPTVISISEDAIRSVPESYKSASLALGASRLQTLWKVTVPAALSGIIAAIMLGMGRVIGETMAVLMVTGNAAVVTASPLASVRTMTATIAAEMGEVPFGSDHYRALFWVGIVLLVATFGLNMVAQRVLKKHQER